MPNSNTYKELIPNISKFYETVQMPGRYSFSHPETLKRIDLYYNSKFESGNKDSAGLRKYFFNITKPACDIATKFIDLDTKDITLVSLRADDEARVWLMQRDLKQWLKDNEFGVLLNEIAFDYPKYGTVVIKKTKNGLENVSIQNLRMDPTAESLDKSPFVYEVHLMTRREIEDMGWPTKEILDAYTTVYEAYEYQVSGDKKWKRSFLAAPFRRLINGTEVKAEESEINDKETYIPPIELFTDELDELPYRELHWERVKGRWLGFGFSEYLYENQIAENEAENLERKALYFKALHIWQTRDDTIGKNLLTDVDSGDILKLNSEITPVNKDQADVAAFNNTRGRWGGNSERKTFTFDVSRGENLPSRTPLGVANLSAGMVASYFDMKRENFAMFVKKLLVDDVIPDFLDDANRDHILTFLGSDGEIEKLDRAISEFVVNEKVLKMAKNGALPSPIMIAAERQKVMQALQEKKNRYLQVPRAFYKESKYFVDILISGEETDTGSKIQTLQVALQIIGSNPAILQNPVTRRVFFWMLEMAGIQPLELSFLQDQSQAAGQPTGQALLPQGGSVALPQPIQTVRSVQNLSKL